MKPQKFSTNSISRRQFLAGSLAATALLATGCGSDTPSATITIPELHYPDSSVLVTPEQVPEDAGLRDLRILDCSSLPSYRRGHVPGARHIWWQDTIELHNPVYGMLVNQEGRARLASAAGIAPGMDIVCYDDVGGTQAARVAWTLRYMGVRSTRIMVGGARGWRSAGRNLTSDQPAGEPGTPIEDIFDESIVAHPGDIVARADEPGLVVLDTRTAEERKETWHGKLRTGMIPGSIWIPRDRLLDTRQIPVPAPELLSLLEAHRPVDEIAEIIVYGLHSTLASLPYFLLLALNRFHVRLYDGSWSQWGSNPDLPIAPLGG